MCGVGGQQQKTHSTTAAPMHQPMHQRWSKHPHTHADPTGQHLGCFRGLAGLERRLQRRRDAAQLGPQRLQLACQVLQHMHCSYAELLYHLFGLQGGQGGRVMPRVIALAGPAGNLGRRASALLGHKASAGTAGTVQQAQHSRHSTAGMPAHGAAAHLGRRAPALLGHHLPHVLPEAAGGALQETVIGVAWGG